MIVNTSKQPRKYAVPSSVSAWKKQRDFFGVPTNSGVLYAITVKPQWYVGEDSILKIGRSRNYLGAVKRIESWDRLMGVDGIVKVVRTRMPVILAERLAKYDAISLCGFGYNSKGEKIELMDGVTKWISATADTLPEFFELPPDLILEFATNYIKGAEIKTDQIK